MLWKITQIKITTSHKPGSSLEKGKIEMQSDSKRNVVSEYATNTAEAKIMHKTKTIEQNNM